MNPGIQKNSFGFHQVANPPSEAELSAYYGQTYFQQERAYSQTYDETELRYRETQLRLRYDLIAPFLPQDPAPSLLDVGCGEGFTLPFFANRGWRVLGADHSDFALRQHHPGYADHFVQGSFGEVLTGLQQRGEHFSVIWLGNVLEHVRDPLALLQGCAQVARPGGLMLIDVPNDFSVLQMAALESGRIDHEFWVALPDHLSYFNADGLRALAVAAGWEHCRTVSDFPIDFNLFHPLANYVEDRKRGSAAHQQRQALEQLLAGISTAKTLDFYEAMANMGVGRSIISVFKLPKP